MSLHARQVSQMWAVDAAHGCAPYVKSTWLRRSTSSSVRRLYLCLHQYSTYSMAVKGAEHLRAALATLRRSRSSQYTCRYWTNMRCVNPS